jgi:hypothetical protein
MCAGCLVQVDIVRKGRGIETAESRDGPFDAVSYVDLNTAMLAIIAGSTIK